MDMMGKSLSLGVPLGDFGIRYQMLLMLSVCTLPACL
jgi:hypothetical protein